MELDPGVEQRPIFEGEVIEGTDAVRGSRGMAATTHFPNPLVLLPFLKGGSPLGHFTKEPLTRHNSGLAMRRNNLRLRVRVVKRHNVAGR